MDGLNILLTVAVLIVAAYLAGTVWLAYKVKGWTSKAAVLVLAFLLPTADTYLGMSYVEHLCAKDGGLRVFRVVDNVDGVLGLAPDKATLERTGYRFVEYRGSFADPSRAYRRIERLPDGEIAESFEATPRARYEVFREHQRIDWFFIRFGILDDLVRDRVSGEVLARYRQVGGGAGLAARFIGQFSDAGYSGAASCPPPDDWITRDRLAALALKPAAN